MAGPFQVGRNRVVIDAPAQQVFDYLADLSNISEWSGEANFRITKAPEGPPGPGINLRREHSGVMRGPLIVRGGMGDNPLRDEKVSSVTVYEPPDPEGLGSGALVVETRNSYNGLLHSIEKYYFEFLPETKPDTNQETKGTRVTMVSEIEPMIPGMFIGPVYAIRLVRSAFGRVFGNRLAGLLPQATVGPHLSRVKERVEAVRAQQP